MKSRRKPGRICRPGVAAGLVFLLTFSAGCAHAPPPPVSAPAAALKLQGRPPVLPLKVSEDWCSYARPRGELERYEHCLELKPDGSFSIRPEHVGQMRFGWSAPRNLAALYFQGGAAYVDRQGRFRPAFFFDNGPDYFAEGLARAIGPDGKMGFMNERLELVIPPRFDFVTPFKKGKAHFCEGCLVADSPDEHPPLVGGRWGEIDREGRVLTLTNPPIH